jgi:hypothetical protein
VVEAEASAEDRGVAVAPVAEVRLVASEYLK